MFTVGFAIGMGPVMPLYCSEIVPAVGMGMAIAMQWLMTTVVGKVAPL